MSNLLKETLRAVLVKRAGVKEIRAVAAQAATDKKTYDTLVELVQDTNVSTRMKSSWALAKATEEHPEYADQHIDLLMMLIDSEKTQGVVREIFKTLAATILPEKHEGSFIDVCFNMLRSPETDLAVKHHSKSALFNYVKKYPELKTELIEALYTVLDAHTAPWKVQVLKTIAKLEKTQ